MLTPLSTCVLLALPALRAPQEPTLPASDVRDVLTFESAGCDALLVDAKDAGLRAAVSLLEERLGELPAEVGESWSSESMRLPVQLLRGPKVLRVALDAAAAGGFPVRAQVEIPGATPVDADALTIRATDFLADVAPRLQKDIDPSGLFRVGTGQAPVLYGAVGSSFVVSLGPPRPAAEARPSELPAGVQPVMRASADVGAMLGFVAKMARNTGAPFDPRDVLGITDLQVDWELGVGADRSYAVSRTRGYRAVLEETSGLPAHMLDPAKLRAIPADAVWAAAGVVDFAGALDSTVERIMLAVPEDPFQGKDPLDALNGFIGLHLRDDLAANLGAQWGAYMADSTGGGGMASLVAFVELADAEAFAASLTRLEELVDSLGTMQAKGYVRVERRSYGEQELWSLAFPGLPLPLELSMGIAGGWFLVGATPQAALAGMRQLDGGGPSLLDAPGYREHAIALHGDELGFSYLDSPQLLRGGYGYAVLAAAALSNGVRSRRDEERHPGLVLPPFGELARGARPAVSVSRLVGDDLVATAELDRSILVNLVAGLGWLERLPVAEALGILGLAGAADAAQSGGLGR